MGTDNDMLTLPFGAEDQLREKRLSNKLAVYQPGDVIIRPGQAVETLYQLLEGTVDVIRDLGTSRETRQRFSRDEPAASGSIQWTPILGGRYFFIKKASSLHYVAMTPCTLAVIAPITVRKLYAKRDCLKLVREMIRDSDMPLEMFHEELDRRYDALYYAGFRKEDPANLLRGEKDYVEGDVGERAEGEKLMRDAYVDFACDMIFRLMGEMLRAPDDGTTKIELDKPPLLRGKR